MEVQFRQADSQTGSSICGATVCCCRYCRLKHVVRTEYMNIHPKYCVASYHAVMFACKNTIRLFVLSDFHLNPRTVKVKCVDLFNQLIIQSDSICLFI